MVSLGKPVPAPSPRYQPLLRLSASVRKFCKKYEAVISVLFTVGPTLIKFMSKTIIKRVALSFLGLSALGIAQIGFQEDFRKDAYLDDAGVATVGFGSTKGVRMGDTITVRHALSRLAREVKDEYEAGVASCAGDVLISQGEYDLYLGIAYNIGVSGFCTSTMVKRLRAGDYEGACEAITWWNKITDPKTGKKIPSRGLTNLRNEQYQKCMNGGIL